MKKQNDLLSIIILTHNNENCIKLCLNSLKKFIDFNAEIIIVDNNSLDNTLKYIKTFKNKNKFFKRIEIIENKKNLGVSKSRNQALKIIKGNYVLILDSDTYMIDDSIKIGINFLKENKNIGICIPKMFYKNLEIQDNIRYYPTITSKIKAVLNIFLNKLHIKKEKDVLDYSDKREKEKIFEVDYGICAYLLAKKEVFDSIGFFDEAIFYGPEDVDICLRAKKAGFKVYYNSNINIVHERQRLSHRKIFSKINFYHIQGLIHYFWKHKYLFKIKNNIND